MDLHTTAAELRRMRRLAMLFDLRTFIGSLFLVFGTIVLLDGVNASPDDIARSVGLHLGLGTGACMLAVAVVFLLWTLLSPPDVGRPTEGPDVEAPPPGH